MSAQDWSLLIPSLVAFLTALTALLHSRNTRRYINIITPRQARRIQRKFSANRNYGKNTQ